MYEFLYYLLIKIEFISDCYFTRILLETQMDNLGLL